MFLMEDSGLMLEVQDQMEDLAPMFLMEDSDLMLEVQDQMEDLDPMFLMEVQGPMQEHSMKARGKMEEDKLEITMADSDLMQQDHRTALLADQVDHSMLGDHQETPMEDGLVEEADRHPMPLEQEDPALVSADLHPLLVVVVVVSR